MLRYFGQNPPAFDEQLQDNIDTIVVYYILVGIVLYSILLYYIKLNYALT